MKKFFDRLRRWLIKKLDGRGHKVQAKISVPRTDSTLDYRRYYEDRVLGLPTREK